jgi:WhiB family redox-sensing transcriptional regulator
MDYEDESHLIPDDLAEELCHKCPLLKLCYDFAVANGETYGVWGGINMGKAEDKLW